MLRSFRVLRAATWILASTALVAVGCGDDSAETTSTTGQGGDGSGGDGTTTAQGNPSSTGGGATTSSTGDTTTTTTTTTSGSGGSGGATTSTGTGGGDCGNGDPDAGEECDDGNNDDGDGCSATCTLEIVPGCGNGVLEADEVCDDGNDVAYDGCESDCTASPAEVECEVLAPLPGGGCEVDSGNDAKILTGNVLLPYTVLRGGQVAVDADGFISCVGCDCAAAEPGATVVTCPEGSISPGLINTHEHITYAQNHPAPDTGERYEHRHEWRRGLNGHTEIPAPGSASTDQVSWGELRFVLSGATSLVGSGQALGLLRNLDKEANEGLDAPSVHFDVFPLGDSNGTMRNSGCGYPSIIDQASIEADLAYLPHVSEGISQAARNEFTCLAGSPGQDVLEHQSSYIHGVGLNPSDYQAMAEEGTSLIWSPRSNVSLYGNTAVVTVAQRMGVNIALGTDWVISGSVNMFRELACAAQLNDVYYDAAFSRRDLWKMVTVNAARALGLEKVIGTLAVGTVADIAIFDGSTNADYAAIVDGEQDAVHLLLRGGEPLYGDTDVLDGLPDAPATCNALTSCLSQKSVCLQSEIGKTLAQLDAASGNDYGPFFCNTIADEPTCKPTRPDAVNGSTVYSGDITGGDGDGDGIDDADDNCPTVFNPVRPMDNGAQGDADADDVGDACDPCPLDANVDVCPSVDPADEDSDGIPDFYDNCPYDANTLQVDADDDGHGDVCDQCPDQPNPGFGGVCAVDIYAVKTGVATGTVALTDVLVTGCANARGYFLQHKAGDPAYDGVENSGLFVFDPTIACGTDLAVGDRLDITGTVSVFYQQIQLGFADFTVISSGDTAPTPVVLTAAQASGTSPNAYEGVLAKVEGVTVTDNAPPPGGGDSAPTGEYQVDGALRIDNFLYTALPIPAEGTDLTSITGIHAFKNDNQKMEPRNAGDVVP